MGFDLSYLACTQPIAEIAKIYGLTLGPAHAAIPDDNNAWIAELANGWTIWMQPGADAFGLRAINPHHACGPLGKCAYTVSVAEFCMHSSIARYIAGAKTFSVSHHGDGKDPEHLRVTGKLPPIYEILRDNVLAEQRGQAGIAPADAQVPDELKAIAARLGGTVSVKGIGQVDHVFDLPMRLGDQIFGFRHDRHTLPDRIKTCQKVLGFGNPQFPAKAEPSPKLSVWQRIFRR